MKREQTGLIKVTLYKHDGSNLKTLDAKKRRYSF